MSKGDKKIKAATQEILDILRRHDLSAFFILQGREQCEVRWRFATWSCFEQVPHPSGSLVNFRTRKGGTGERRSEQDIADSCNIARSFAQETGKAALSAIDTWKALEEKLGAHGTYEDFRGAPPPWDLR